MTTNMKKHQMNKTSKSPKVYVITKIAICNENPEDSIFEIVGIFKNRSDAVKTKNNDQKMEDDKLREMEDDGFNPNELPDFEYKIKSMNLS